MPFFHRTFFNRKADVWLALMLIVILTFGLRIYRLTQIPSGFFCDEASFGYNALTISQNLHDEYGNFLPLYFQAFGDYKSPLPIYLAAPIIKVFGLSVFSVRLIGAIFGTLTVLILYFLAREIFKKYDNSSHRILPTSEQAALLASLMLAISPWHLQFSRSGLWDITIFPLFFLLSLYLTILAFEKKQVLPLAFLVWGITVYSYNVGRILVPLMIFRILFLGIRQRIWSIKQILVSLAIFILVALPSYFMLLGPGANRWNQVSVINIQEPAINKTVRLAGNYLSHFSPDFLFLKGENSFITRHAVLGMGELYLWELPFIAIGLIGLIRRKDNLSKLLLFSLALYPLGAALSDRAPSASRAFLGSVLFPIVTTNGLLLTKEFLIKRGIWLKRFWRWFLLSLVSIVVTSSFVGYLTIYYRFYPLQSSDFWGWQYGSQEIVSYFKAHQSEYDELIMSSQFNEPTYFFKFFELQTPCPKCLIGNLDNINSNKKQLFALAPNEISEKRKINLNVKKRILYPDGRLAFLIFAP